MKATKNSPNDFKVWTYSKFLEISHLPVIRQIIWIISLFFVEAAPKVPISLKRSFSGASGKQAFIIGYALAFLFCFGANVLLTYFNNTLYFEQDPTKSMLFFLEDYWNIILYTVICPLYVGLTCWLVVVVIKGWGDINAFKENEVINVENKPKPSQFAIFKAMFLGFLILAVAFALTTNYINDIEKLANNSEVLFEGSGKLGERKIEYYWFFTKTNSETGEMQLKSLGVYYFLLNYSLLIITLIALTFFMSIYKMMMGVGKALKSKTKVGDLDFDTLKIKLSAFTEAYILTKGLIAVYIFNVVIWIKSPLGENTTDGNIQIAVILLGLIGVFMVSIPRYYVELQWYRLKNKAKDDKAKLLDYEDLRPFWMNWVATALDTLLIGGFIFEYGKYAFG